MVTDGRVIVELVTAVQEIVEEANWSLQEIWRDFPQHLRVDSGALARCWHSLETGNALEKYGEDPTAVLGHLTAA